MTDWKLKLQPKRSPLVSGILPAEEHGSTLHLMPHLGLESRPVVPMRPIFCPYCERDAEVPAAAVSAHCEHCHGNLQLGDFTFSPSTLRSTVRTQGDVLIRELTVQSNLTIFCRHLTMRGRGDGDIRCMGICRVLNDNDLTRPLRAQVLELKAGCRLSLKQGARLESADIAGELQGDLEVSGVVRLRAGAVLRGHCRAAAMDIAPGAIFDGNYTPHED